MSKYLSQDTIPFLLSPVASCKKFNCSGLCILILSYLTHPRHVQLARDLEFDGQSKIFTLYLLLFEPCLLQRCPAGMFNQENWCVDIAVQLEGEFHLCIFRLSGYYYYNKFSEVSTTNSSLNHYTSTTESVYFRHIATSKTLKLNRDSLLKCTILAIESASDVVPSSVGKSCADLFVLSLCMVQGLSNRKASIGFALSDG